MEPEFVDGDLVLIEPLLRIATLNPGDVVVARHPFKNLDVIKSVGTVDDDGLVALSSPSGEDSRQFGRVPYPTIRGRVSVNLSGYTRRS